MNDHGAPTATSRGASSTPDGQVLAEAIVLADVRDRGANTAERADQWTATLLGGGFLAVCAIGLTQLAWPSAIVGVVFVVLGLLYVQGSRVAFESTAGSAVATQPLLVASLFLLPLPLVPIVVTIGLLGGRRQSAAGGRLSRFFVTILSGWQCLGPIAVLALAGAREPSFNEWPVYLVALASQFIIDAVVAAIRCWALGISWRVLPRPMLWMFGIDALLAPIGLMAVLAVNNSIGSAILAATPIGVLALLSRDRTENFEKTAVMGEVVEQAMHAARTDPLTQIGNRRAWNEAVASAAVRFAADPDATAVTVIMGDLDGLKWVNDTHGHDAGDQLIRSAADVFGQSGGPDAFVARLGGDEFGLLVVSDRDLTAEVVQTVNDAIAASAAVGDVRLSISIGAAACPPCNDVEAACSAADDRALANKATRKAQRAARVLT